MGRKRSLRAEFNHELRRRRIEAGLTFKALATAAGIHATIYHKLEFMKVSPLDERSGDWRTIARKLSEFWRVPEEDLFPKAAEEKRKRAARAEAVVSAVECCSEYTSCASRQEFDFDYLDAPFLAAAVDRVLNSLPDSRRIRNRLRKNKYSCEDIIRMRFHEDMTLQEIADIVGVNRERIRQIEVKALRMLRHPSRSRWLKQYVVGEDGLDYHARSFVEKERHVEEEKAVEEKVEEEKPKKRSKPRSEPKRVAVNRVQMPALKEVRIGYGTTWYLRTFDPMEIFCRIPGGRFVAQSRDGPAFFEVIEGQICMMPAPNELCVHEPMDCEKKEKGFDTRIAKYVRVDDGTSLYARRYVPIRRAVLFGGMRKRKRFRFAKRERSLNR